MDDPHHVEERTFELEKHRIESNVLLSGSRQEFCVTKIIHHVKTLSGKGGNTSH